MTPEEWDEVFSDVEHLMAREDEYMAEQYKMWLIYGFDYFECPCCLEYLDY